MTFDALGELNWLAVVVATAAYFALGATWYAPPVFGKAWMRASGIVMTEGQRPGPEVYLGPLVANFVAAVATGMLALATGSSTFSHGVVLGLVVGVGYAISMTLLEAVFGTKPEPRTWFFINGAYHVLGLLIVAVIVSTWS